MLILNPGLTETEMTANNDFSGLPMKLMQPIDVVKFAINALVKKTLITPGFYE
jgi:short-subunit dehydrogenase